MPTMPASLCAHDAHGLFRTGPDGGYRNGRRPRPFPLWSCGFRTGPDGSGRSRWAFESTSPAAAHQLHDARSERSPHSAVIMPRGPTATVARMVEQAGRWGTTMPVTRDSPSIQGDVLAQTPQGDVLAQTPPGSP